MEAPVSVTRTSPGHVWSPVQDPGYVLCSDGEQICVCPTQLLSGNAQQLIQAHTPLTVNVGCCHFVFCVDQNVLILQQMGNVLTHFPHSEELLHIYVERYVILDMALLQPETDTCFLAPAGRQASVNSKMCDLGLLRRTPSDLAFARFVIL